MHSAYTPIHNSLSQAQRFFFSVLRHIYVCLYMRFIIHTLCLDSHTCTIRVLLPIHTPHNTIQSLFYRRSDRPYSYRCSSFRKTLNCDLSLRFALEPKNKKKDSNTSVADRDPVCLFFSCVMRLWDLFPRFVQFFFRVP